MEEDRLQGCLSRSVAFAFPSGASAVIGTDRLAGVAWRNRAPGNDSPAQTRFRLRNGFRSNPTIAIQCYKARNRPSPPMRRLPSDVTVVLDVFRKLGDAARRALFLAERRAKRDVETAARAASALKRMLERRG